MKKFDCTISVLVLSTTGILIGWLDINKLLTKID